MKIRLILLLTLLGTACMQAQNTEQMVFRNDFRESSGGLGNITSLFMSDGWWNDVNGNPAAVIRIKVVDMSVAEMQKLSVKGSPNLGLGKIQFFEKEQQWLVAVSSGSNMYLEMVHPTYGTSSRLNINQNLTAKTIYDVTLVNNRTTSIVVRSIPEGADVYLDGEKKGSTPCEIIGQRYGAHNLKLMYKDKNLVQEIDVEEGHTVFDKFDFRERVNINIASNPKGAAIFVDDEMVGKAPINGYSIILGAHKFRAELNATQVDEQSISITSSTTSVVLNPVKKSNIQIITKYGGKPVEARLVVDNEKSFTGEKVYHFELPYSQHVFRSSYGGKTKEKKIKVNSPETNYVFNLSAKNSFVWPWQRSYNGRPLGFAFGFVSKQCIIKGTGDYNGQKVKMEPAYSVIGKSLNGIRAGIFVNPAFSFGLGLYSGLFYELYGIKNSDYEQNKFLEHSLNLPVHASFRLPFSREIALHIHGGIGFDLGLSATYKGGDDDAYNYKSSYYGSEGMKRCNITADVAAGINFYWFMINAFYSKGISNHNLSEIGNTKANKFGISIAFMPSWK